MSRIRVFDSAMGVFGGGGFGSLVVREEREGGAGLWVWEEDEGRIVIHWGRIGAC
jgi:hypothetical protein